MSMTGDGIAVALDGIAVALDGIAVALDGIATVLAITLDGMGWRSRRMVERGALRGDGSVEDYLLRMMA